jgi:hypothetical protein
MPIDIEAAERFVLANARLLDRHRHAVLLHDHDTAPVLGALRAYRNPDGGFGHALEPDIRDPESQPAATVHALDVLAEANALDDPMVAEAAAWAGRIAAPDGGVPFILDTPSGGPRAPFLSGASPSEGSFLTFAFLGPLLEAGSGDAYVERATEWCWSRLDDGGDIGAYGVRAALIFLDAVPDADRAERAIETLRPLIEADGSIAVQGGTEGERLHALKLSPRPGARSRALFTDEQIEADLERLEREQREDGGWDFDWLAWSQGQTADCRGGVTVDALATLRAHGR